MRRTRRRIRKTCPHCGLTTLTRIARTGGLGGVRLVSRYCVNCQYSDGHGWELVPTSEDEALAIAKTLGTRAIVLDGSR